MGTTDSNGIYFPETTDAVSPLQVLLGVMQQSVSDAFDATLRTWPASNSAARTALLASKGSSAAKPLVVYQQDTDQIWRHNGSSWRMLNAPSRFLSIGNYTLTSTYATLTDGTTLNINSIPAGKYFVHAKGFVTNGAAATTNVNLQLVASSGVIDAVSVTATPGSSVPWSLSAVYENAAAFGMLVQGQWVGSPGAGTVITAWNRLSVVPS